MENIEKVRCLLAECSPGERARIAQFFASLADQKQVQDNIAAALDIQEGVSVKMAIAEGWRNRKVKSRPAR